jgi:putative transposase
LPDGMVRLPRIVLPGIPRHVTHRGNRREWTVFEDGDYASYRDLWAEAAGNGGDGWNYGDSLLNSPIDAPPTSSAASRLRPIIFLSYMDSARHRLRDEPRFLHLAVFNPACEGVGSPPVTANICEDSRAY